jgi:putative ABC transport system permease protein
VLLIGAGLFIRSFYQLIKVDPGFNPEYVLSVQVILPQLRYPDRKDTVGFFRQLTDRVKELPGVQQVGMASRVPLDENQWQSSFWIEGRPDPGPGKHPSAEINLIDPNYLHTIGIKLLKGREFTEQDDRDHPFVVIIDESFAKQYWPDDDPIGKRIQLWSDNPKEWPTVVGIVNTIKLNSLDGHETPRVQLYIPYYRIGDSGMCIVARAGGNPINLTTAIRDQVRALDKDQPIYESKTLLQVRDDSVASQRLSMILLGSFAALALVLSGVGIYGVMSYLVTQRTHEIGLRMALGAQIADVLKLVVGHALALALIGVATGLGAAFFLTKLISSLLFSVSATDPITFVAVPVALTSIALLATFIPARRASKVDPMIALRYE